METSPASGPPAPDAVPIHDAPVSPRNPARPPASLAAPRGDVEPTPVDFYILGPRRGPTNTALWAVVARILAWATKTHETEPGWLSRGLRTLYTSAVPAPSLPSLTLFPGTLVARCRILTARITINGLSFDYQAPDATPVDTTLLLQTDNDDWVGDNPNAFLWSEAVCVGGQIPFDSFVRHPQAPVDQASWTTRFPFFQDGSVTSAVLSSSGLGFEAQALLPWGPMPTGKTAVKPAPYLVEVRLPTNPSDETSPLVVLPDLERLADPKYRQASAGFLAAFAALVKGVSPRPDDATPTHPAGLLRWVSLDLTVPGTIPSFFWDMRSKANGQHAISRLLFDPGTWTLRVSDQPLGFPGVNPQGVLSATPDVSIGDGSSSADPSRLEFRITAPGADGQPARAGTATLMYTATLMGADFTERMTLKNIETCYDAPATARFLRQLAGQPEPGFDAPPEPDADAAAILSGVTATAPLRDNRIDPPVLHGVLPIDEGWVQLPFLNVTEQILFDSLPEPARVTRDSVLGGGAIFGTAGEGLLDPKSGEIAWSLALLDAASYTGSWVLKNLQLQSVTLELDKPVVTVRGLLALATAVPTTADSLPTLDNWLGALTPLTLRSFDLADRYPSPFVVTFPDLTFERADIRVNSAVVATAKLRAWSFGYATNDHLVNTKTAPAPTVYEQLLYHSRYDAERFWSVPAYAWRRHGRTPMIQSLPMTQNSVPPNNPSASRALYPYVLPVSASDVKKPVDWVFAVKDAGAASWPSAPDKATPETAGDGLLLVSLCHPGLVFDPMAQWKAGVFANVTDLADQFLPAQYRHDLPFLDEVNALATLPKNGDAPAAGDSPSIEPPPLRPEDYAAYWEHLSELAFFAEADAAPALVPGTPVVARGLIEPLDWPVTATFSTRAYPGSLGFVGPNGRNILLAGDGVGHEALRGLEGAFHLRTDGHLELTDPTTADFVVVGESMLAALRPSGRLRDQRGLERGATETVAAARGPVLRTRVALADDPGPAAAVVDLWSTTSALDLKPTPATTWKLWFRDLPATESGATSAFDRSKAVSAQRRGINNPSALSRTQIALNNYEWRLGDGTATSSLALGPLRFFPLTLEKAALDAAGNLTALEVVGRLHLPLTTAAEEPEPDSRANAVRLAFDASGTLTSITPESPDFDDGPAPAAPAAPVVNEWPLSDVPDAPVVRWTHVDIVAGGLTVHFRLAYRSHGVSWTLPETTLPVPFAAPFKPVVTYNPGDFQSGPDDTVAILSATLALNLSLGHTFTVQWQFAWGNPRELRLVAVFDDAVLPPRVIPAGSLSPLSAQFEHGGQKLRLRLGEPGGKPPLMPNLDGNAVQIQWSGVDTTTARPAELQVLPGFYLSGDALEATRGYALLGFELVDQPSGLPHLNGPTAGRLEALFACRWGVSLFAPLASVKDSEERLFGSSSGRIDAAYTSRYGTDPNAPTRWSTDLLLNGLLEVTNLVSWPSLLAPVGNDGDINLVTLPVSRAAAGPPPSLSHVRHAVRVLFNQHTVPAEVVEPSSSDPIFLQIKSGAAWTTRAAVEHQLLWVDPDNPVVGMADRQARLTLVQEIRFAAPDAFVTTLGTLNGVNTLDASRPALDGERADVQSSLVAADRLAVVARGYLGQTMTDRLAGAGGALVNQADLIVVEASVPAYIATAPARVTQPSNLAYLPGGTTRATLSALSDYQTSPGSDFGWLLLLIPFLGRTQPHDRDQIPSPTAPPARPATPPAQPDVRVDPVLQIKLARDAGTASANRLALSLANREDLAPVSVALAEFDLARNRQFPRLDPSSLRESWFRLSLSPSDATIPSDQLSSVLADAPTDEPGTLSRLEVLNRVVAPFREYLPPDPRGSGRLGALSRSVAGAAGATAVPRAASPFPAPIVWNPASLLLIDTDGFSGTERMHSEIVLAEFGFLGPGVMLQQAGLVPATPGLAVFAAATLIPPCFQTPRGLSIQPVSVAVSPYLGLDFVPTPKEPGEDDEWVLGLSELVVFDTTKQATVSLATRFWYPPKNPTTGPRAYALIRAWARDTWSRFASDSPVAAVRLREIYRAADGSGVTVTYRFLSPESIATPLSPARRSLALRPDPAQLRFAQGQFGGTAVPLDALAPFELAPPQVSGVQPLRLDGRSGADWPWGLSALRVSVRQADAMHGIAGPPVDSANPKGRIWWQALAHNVQYSEPDDPAGRQVLPRMFRARAIPGLLPSWPRTPLPGPAEIVASLAPGADMDDGPAWQPILPGGYTLLVSGTRPGVPFAFLESIQTHDIATGWSIQSGSVPVMHRTPRPVMLPPNRQTKLDVALQTWPGSFDPTTTVSAGPSPSDTAFLADETLAVELSLTLALTLSDSTGASTSIDDGTIPADFDNQRVWDGTLRFNFVARSAFGDLSSPSPETKDPTTLWTLSADITDGTTTLTFNKPTTKNGPIELEPDDSGSLTKWLQRQAHGTPVTVRVQAVRNNFGAVANYRQTLSFPARIDRGPGTYRLPYVPTFLRFEDPEYNRRLATSTAQKTAIVSVPLTVPSVATAAVNVTLAADRREYNVTGAIHYLFFCDNFDSLPPEANAALSAGNLSIQLFRNDPLTGPTKPLLLLSIVGLPVKMLPAKPAQLDLSQICPPEKGRLRPGDTLLLELTFPTVTGSPTIELAVSIVARPVTPAPDAGYALLRREPDGAVHCARFAFGPVPARVELLDTGDLLHQVVRRRAVFHWQDTVRVGPTRYSYAVQKITTTGSTHFPTP
jgi:hypothetical protein